MAVPAKLDKPVDLFYLYPTTFSKANKDASNFAAIDDPGMVKGAKLSFSKQATAFEPIANIYAPYYRQVDAAYSLSLPPAEHDKVQQGVTKEDVFAAFDYYIQHYNNGRPFILAAHSQGSNELIFLLADYMKANPKVNARMVAAYVIGYSVTSSYLAANPHLKFAEGPGDTGVIVSYNTEAPTTKITNPVTLPGGISINPITWTRTEKLADASENAGSLQVNPDGTVAVDASGNPIILKNWADAQVNIARGVVICSTVDASKLSPGTANQMLSAGIYHNFDYPLYYFNIRENAALRVKNYLSQH